MPAGMTIIGEHGLYQVDDASYVMTLLSHGNLSSLTNLGNSGEGVDCPTYRLTTTIASPIFGLYLPASTNYVGGVRKTSLSGSTWTCDYQLWGKIGVSRNLTNAKYFIFGRMTSQGSSGSGLEIYDATGAVIFNSQQKMRTIAGPADTTLDTSKRYCVIGSGVSWSDHLDVDYVTTDVWSYHSWKEGEGYNTGLGGATSQNVVIYDDSGMGAGGGGFDNYYYGVNQIAQCIDVTDVTT